VAAIGGAGRLLRKWSRTGEFIGAAPVSRRPVRCGNEPAGGVVAGVREREGRESRMSTFSPEEVFAQ
jgi:hypothetical protein